MEGSGPRDGADRPASYALPAARGGGPSRPLQVGSLLMRTLQEILARGLNDPRYRGLVSILEVRVSPDLADAILVTPAGQAGLPTSPHFRSLHGPWQKGEAFPLLPGDAARRIELERSIASDDAAADPARAPTPRPRTERP